jgi:SAM-dependent methyltransferase
MRRETTNMIRTVLEEVLPPVLRDSAPMRWVFRRHWGRLVDDIEAFRERITFVTAEEYRDIYERLPRVQDETDNSAACLDRIVGAVEGGSVLDVGCGTGYVLDHLKRELAYLDLTGVDFIVEEGTRARHPDIRFEQASIEKLPFADASFDTVICTHVLEHILDFRQALSELRRVTRRKLILVVPQEREYRFTFNPHLHFFPYPHSFLRYLTPVPDDHELEGIGRDIFYAERRPDRRHFH